MTNVEIRVADDPGEEAARLIADAAAGGHIGLSGGSGPRPAYTRAGVLCSDWSQAHLWFIDDRVVPPADALSNYRLVRESLLDGLARPPHVHRIQTELDAENAADDYDRALMNVCLDLAVMGIGPDGHTASLFPNAPALDVVDRRAIAVEAGMEPFVPRVTMTRPMLALSRTMLYLVTGESKADAVKRAFADDPSPATPASLVRGEQTIVLLDAAAASLLDL